MRKLKRCLSRMPGDLDFVVCLGDRVDSPNDAHQEREGLHRLRDELSQLQVPVHHVLGNHDLMTMDRQTHKAALADKRPAYYAFWAKGIRCIVLDANYRSDGTPYASGNFDWQDAALPELEEAFLQREIRQHDPLLKCVFIHQNLDPRAQESRNVHVVRNAAAIRQILAGSQGPVVVWQGHDHSGLDQTIQSVRYVTLPAMCTGKTLVPGACRIVSIDEHGHLGMIDVQE